MRNGRRWLAAALSAGMVFSLAACGGTANTGKTSGSASGGGAPAITGPMVTFLNVDAKAQIANLKTQGMTDPLGMDVETPAFSWQMLSDVVGAAQKAYQIVVKNPKGEVMWDSGKVESPVSHEVMYEGKELEASTRYTWSVQVTDTADQTVESDPAFFETALLSDSVEAWDGAQWIGAPDLQLDAASACVFRISTDVQIPEGSNHASLIFGADDFRLNHAVFNMDSMEGENYVRLELDVSEVDENGGAKIHVYRAGYFEGDQADTPYLTIEGNEALNGAITSANKNEKLRLTLDCSASEMTVSVNEVEVDEKIVVNDLGGDSSYNTFPNLASIGFAARAGEKAVFTDYKVENGGKYGTGTLFGETAGATYTIFDGLTGITVAGNQITVDSSAGAVLEYADPTYGAAPMLRTEFETKSDVESARLYLTAQGIYNFYLNGQEIAPEEWFNPGASEYDAELGYNTYDVTEYLTEGANAMGAVLGEGWWTGQMTFEASNSNYFGDQPALMAKLKVDYEDGSSDVFVTDPEKWDFYNDGPVRYASFFQGERYDATKEAAVEGWSEAGYDASRWEKSAVVETRPAFADVRLVTRTDSPVHVIRTNEVQEALGASKEGTNSYIYDMGENVSGVPLITIPAEYAKAGETVTVRFAETLYPELEEYTSRGIAGRLMVENYRAAMVTDFYTMKEGEQVIAPDLTFHGYRYIEISGLEKELPAECVQMQVLSSLDATGTYHSSNELANQLYRNITNSTTSNYISIPTDCPQRNERMGWTGDAQIFALSGSYVADTYNFMGQWMNSVRADSGENGMSAQYSPAFVQYNPEDASIEHNGQSFGITWNSLAVSIPYHLYMQTGRKTILEENRENIYAYVDTLVSTPFKYKDAKGEKKEDDRLTGETGTLADHLSRVTTDSVLLGNALYIKCLDQASVIAAALEDTEKAEAYSQKAKEARTAWNEVFLDSETGKTQAADGSIQDTQASYATPLRFGVISEENLEKVLENYEKTIAEPEGQDNDGKEIIPYTLTTGFNATGNLLNALSDYGLNETAYQLFESEDYASWLYPVTQGATSIWERWNSYTVEDGFGGNNSMNSFNHYSYGAVCEWMIGYQAGITVDETCPGYQNFILQPTAGGDFTELTGSYDSVYGTITSGWTAENGKLTSYEVTIPANTAATLYLPVTAKEISEVEGAKYIGSEPHNGIETEKFELVAGTWRFEVSGENITITAGK